jgi:ATP-binding cassette subfamily B protein
MISKYYGKDILLDSIREICYIIRDGVSLLGISQGAETLGYKTIMVKTDTEALRSDCPLPAILHWNDAHFVVLYEIKKDLTFLNFTFKRSKPFIIADPAHGLKHLSEAHFNKC